MSGEVDSRDRLHEPDARTNFTVVRHYRHHHRRLGLRPPPTKKGAPEKTFTREEYQRAAERILEALQL